MRHPIDLTARPRIARLALAAVLLLSGCTVAKPAAPSPVAPSGARSLARLEPSDGTYFGVSLDWATDNAQSFAQRLGRSAAVYVAFAQFPTNASEDTYLDQFISQVRGQGGLALLTLEPRVPLGEITPAMAASFGERLDGYNARGVPVIVRFAHEMNGSWYPWSQQPTDFVRAFRVLAAAVHERARSSAMLWAPNYGAGYPFEDTPGARVAQPGTPDFQVLDTNHDGVLDARDDMYAPYYPGDDAVDWVGMTLYHWGDSWPWGKNVVPEDGKFTAQLTGTYVGAGGDQRGLPNFYQVYAGGHGKPMAIPETAAFYNTSVGGDPELSIKRAWWRQVFSTEIARQFPSIKMINWFEWRKPELEVGNALVDWTATLDPELRDAFVADLPVDRLLFGKGPEPQTVDAVSEPPAPAAASGPAPETTSESAIPDGRRAIDFAGYTWRVRTASGLEGPGPNYFSDSPEHVWVDADGRLHLRVAREPDGRWYAAEVTSQDSLGYGTYQFTLDSRVDNLDPNAAIGMFTWSDDATQNHRELDVEFARFGQPLAPVGRYTRQPYTDPGNVSLFVQPAVARSTHTFVWRPDQVGFASWIGGAEEHLATIASHTFTRAVPEPGGEHVHLNLWLDAGQAPTDGQPIEIIFRSFAFSRT